MKIKKIFLGVGIVANALIMVFFALYLMKLPWLAGDEKFLIWSSSAIKFNNRDMPSSDEFAFINTSYDLQLIDRFDEFGFPVGNQVITDRQKLGMLMDILASGEKKPKYVICDIHFVDSTDFDKELHAALRKMDNIILSSHLNDSGMVDVPIFNDINRGLSDYVIGSIFDGVYKYQLFYQDTLKLTPLKVHEKLSGEKAEIMGPLVKIGDRWTLNNFIMNYRVVQKDILDMEAGFNPVSLGELLFLEDKDIQDFTADKIVVIGDFFEADMHETLFEITAGPLILINAYLTIKEGDAVANIWFFFIVFAVFLYLSYMVFVEGDYMEKKITKLFGTIAIAKYLAGFASYITILALLSLLTFFLFHIHLNIFFLAVAFYLMDKIVGFIYSKTKNS
ncbi:MAG: CHASE2 domain-containing protein [Cyclobacteriaceae bacterium]